MAREHFPYETALNDLLATYRQAQQTLIAQIAFALASGRPLTARQRRAQLAEVLRVLDELGVQTDPRAREIAAQAFQQSAQRTAQLAAGLNVGPVSEATFTGVSREAVKTLQDSIIASLSDARTTVGRQVVDVFARAQRRSVMLGLLGSHGSRRAVSADMVQALRDKGVTGFVDRAGRQWALDTYAEMAARTVTREAVVQGATMRMAAQGVEYCQVSTHLTACPICQPMEGKVMALDGSIASLPGVETESLTLPPFHPNCQHTVVPYVPALAAVA